MYTSRVPITRIYLYSVTRFLLIYKRNIVAKKSLF